VRPEVFGKIGYPGVQLTHYPNLPINEPNTRHDLTGLHIEVTTKGATFHHRPSSTIQPSKKCAATNKADEPRAHNDVSLYGRWVHKPPISRPIPAEIARNAAFFTPKPSEIATKVVAFIAPSPVAGSLARFLLIQQQTTNVIWTETPDNLTVRCAVERPPVFVNDVNPQNHEKPHEHCSERVSYLPHPTLYNRRRGKDKPVNPSHSK
jgi:hypothetical protein